MYIYIYSIEQLESPYRDYFTVFLPMFQIITSHSIIVVYGCTYISFVSQFGIFTQINLNSSYKRIHGILLSFVESNIMYHIIRNIIFDLQ